MVMVRLKGSESFAKSSFDLRRLIYFLVGDSLSQNFLLEKGEMEQFTYWVKSPLPIQLLSPV